MPAPEFAALVRAVIADFGDVAVWWQVAVLGFALGAAWVIAARTALRVRSGDRAGQSEVRRFGRHGLLRIVFPLSALILVVAARAVLDNFHNVSLLNLAVPLLLSLAVIRVVVYAVRQAVGRGSWVAAFERLFAALAWGVVALHILGWLPGEQRHAVIAFLADGMDLIAHCLEFHRREIRRLAFDLLQQGHIWLGFF